MNATARDQYRVMVVIDGEGHGAPNSWLRLSSIVLYDITAALSSKSSRTEENAERTMTVYATCLKRSDRRVRFDNPS